MQTAIHEIGHVLGFGHSDMKEAVMWAWTTPYDPDFQLHQDDINVVQRLYGVRGLYSIESIFDLIYTKQNNTKQNNYYSVLSSICKTRNKMI